ncbi:MAG TPA: metalloregulator ArsR/SmtB family transcription factor [Jiangellaceae bacterium]|nr:metalloregulator ArsR/SmtB family transcription factor [Jiangellaceae bacterium]
MNQVERAAPVDEAAALTAAACLFHGFSDPSRLAILRHLALGEHRVVDLTQHLGLAQSTVSKHLACLRDCGLVTSRPEGRASMFSLNHTDTVLELLAAAERLLAVTGDAVTLCPTYGTPPPSRLDRTPHDQPDPERARLHHPDRR